MNKATATKERPIIFSGEMVRAILDGRKTQTRRVVKPDVVPYCQDVLNCPYGAPGDRLWVREAFWENYDGLDGMDFAGYVADGPARKWQHHEAIRSPSSHKCPSIHMARRHSRILLEVVSVRVERLQEISEADCLAEGIEPEYPGDMNHGDPDGFAMDSMVRQYRSLWDRINAKRAPWESNPWVWVIEFKRVSA